LTFKLVTPSAYRQVGSGWRQEPKLEWIDRPPEADRNCRGGRLCCQCCTRQSDQPDYWGSDWFR